MCPPRRIDEPNRLESVIALVHAASRLHNEQPIDLYRLHAYFTVSDEPEDDVADAKVQWDFE